MRKRYGWRKFEALGWHVGFEPICSPVYFQWGEDERKNMCILILIPCCCCFVVVGIIAIVFPCIDKKGVILTNLLKEFYLQSDNPFLDGLKFYAKLHMGSTVKTNSIEYIGMVFLGIYCNFIDSFILCSFIEFLIQFPQYPNVIFILYSITYSGARATNVQSGECNRYESLCGQQFENGRFQFGETK